MASILTLFAFSLPFHEEKLADIFKQPYRKAHMAKKKRLGSIAILVGLEGYPIQSLDDS